MRSRKVWCPLRGRKDIEDGRMRMKKKKKKKKKKKRYHWSPL